MFSSIKQVIEKIDTATISENRKLELQVLVNYIQEKRRNAAPISLHFICTHNSRRSQFSQLWAQVASDYFKIDAKCYSGGVEETSFNSRAIESLIRFGFSVSKTGDTNPVYTIKWDTTTTGLNMFSKLYDHSVNPSSNFAAIMTCGHADENCPFVVGCDARIPIRYSDPKVYDNTPLESAFYDYRSFEIATELFYIFSKIKNNE